MCGVAVLGTESLRLVNHVTDGTGEPVTVQARAALWPSMLVTVPCTALAVGKAVHGKDSTLTCKFIPENVIINDISHQSMITILQN